MANFKSLPEEMQLRIMEFCDDETLAALCRTSHEMHRKTLPILWGEIDFQETADHIGPQWKFLMLCDDLITDDADRWYQLGSLVRSLVFYRMPGIGIPHKREEDLENADSDFIFWPGDTGGRNVYDVLAQLTNMERLSIFVKDCWEDAGALDNSARSLEAGLTKLRSVKVGGQILPEVLLALCSRAEQIESLSLINLIWTPGQDDGPNPVLFLEPIQHRFTNLTYLHLSKLAELAEDYEVAKLRWEWDVEQENLLLKEWAGLIEHVHATLVALKLENSYHAAARPIDFVNELAEQEGQKGDEEEGRYGALQRFGTGSSDRCKAILFPSIAKHEWPSLRRVTLMGIHMHDGRGEPSPFAKMGQRVSVEDLPGSLLRVVDETTPMNISPPNGLFDDVPPPVTRGIAG